MGQREYWTCMLATWGLCALAAWQPELAGACFVGAFIAWGSAWPSPAQSVEQARSRLRAVIAADRAASNDGRWVPAVPRVRVERVDMGWTPGAVFGTRVWFKSAFRWEPRR